MKTSFLALLKKMNRRTFLTLLLLIQALSLLADGTSSIRGTIVDSKTKEPLIGAAVLVVGTSSGTVTNLDGQFVINNLNPLVYKLRMQYIGYKTVDVDVEVTEDKIAELDIELVDNSQTLDAVVVVAQMRKTTETAIITNTKQSLLVESGVSAQQISKTQDKTATEVIRRVPGITINESKFVMVRGLAQRYNNVWINNSAVPSSEPDSRSFSFDIIPSSQLDNIIIIKSPAPEYPADFTGGFIMVNTKEIPAKDGFSIGFSGTYNNETHFKNFLKNPGSSTDFLGFDNSTRTLQGNFPALIDENNKSLVTQLTKSGFYNNWKTDQLKPLGDLGINASMNKSFETENNKRVALLASFNYTNSYTTYRDMVNNKFDIYNAQVDQPEYVNEYIDQQYSANNRLGAMFNITFAPSNKTTYQLKNIFNQLGQNRFTQRTGYYIASQRYKQEQFEYFYNSRATYSGQLSADYNTQVGKIWWNAGYSFANNKRPDRRRINLQENDNQNDVSYGKMELDQNEIKRDFNDLAENIFSADVNYERTIAFGNIYPTLKTGVYGEYRNREYNARQFFYRSNTMPVVIEAPTHQTLVNEVLIDSNFDANSNIYIYEQVDNRNSYSGYNRLLAGYVALNVPITHQLNIYAGIRYENNFMNLTTYTHLRELYTKEYPYRNENFLPSVNSTYKFNDMHQLRLSYGMSVNRQEFREVSPSIFFDFDLFSDVKGNPQLKQADIHNADLRYEVYPSRDEMLSVAIFYKHFNNPIEWTYLFSGGNYTYTFENAQSAKNYGVELEIRKNLAFINLRNFSWIFNGALIKSVVDFEETSNEVSRPMQGQSPYIINTGLFYQHPSSQLSAAILYNRIGKRIVGVGRTDLSGSGSINNDIPDSYEMPRNLVDVTVGKQFGNNWEVKLAIKDLLAEKIVFKEFPRFQDANNKIQERSQITKQFNPGRNISINVNYKF